jgi:hypothetical protein
MQMKVKGKIIIGICSLLFATGLVGTFWGPGIAEAATGIWDSCPKGRVNCAYPGDCHSYIDTNNDAICDRSQSEPVSSSSSSVNTQTSPAATTEENTTDPEAVLSSNSSTGSRNYHFLPILAGLVVLYATTWILATKKIITQVLDRRIWNIVLAVSTLVSALLGMLLLLNLDLGWNITLPFNMLFWHVEAGIALGIVALFHIGWHWRYFTKMVVSK